MTDVPAVAAEVFATIGTGRQIIPFSSRRQFFGLNESYRVTARVRQMRDARVPLNQLLKQPRHVVFGVAVMRYVD